VNLKTQALSISQKLSNIAQKRNTAYFNILTEFLVERLLARITSDQKIYEKLVFKGGYVGLKVYSSPRYTVDIDAVLQNAKLRPTLDRIIKLAEEDIGDCVWLRSEKEMDLTAQGEYGGIRLVFRAGIGELPKTLKRAQIINLDLGIGDPVTPAPIEHETLALLQSEPIHWQVYPVETIIAEKLQTLISRGSDNSRSKDIYDLYLFLPMADQLKFKTAVKACFKFRNSELPENFAEALKKIDLKLLSKGWASSTSTVRDAPSCEHAFKEILNQLTKLNFLKS